MKVVNSRFKGGLQLLESRMEGAEMVNFILDGGASGTQFF